MLVSDLRDKTPPPFKATLSHGESIGEVGLHLLCKKTLGHKRLLIASNRGPVTYEKDAEGRQVAKRGSGGVVTALTSLSHYTPLTWVAAALSDTDREMATRSYTAGHNMQLRFVDIEPACFDCYLNVISNPLLWFVQHQMELNLSHSRIEQAWQDGYIRANQAFARTVLQEASRPDTAPFVIFHDYQLYLTPGMVRQQRPDLTLLHFTHIPWPKPAAWSSLPPSIVQAICLSLLACDIVGFQTPEDAFAFGQTCREYLGNTVGWEIQEMGNYRLNWENREVQIRAYPISVDPAQVRQTYLGESAQNWRERLAELCENVDQVIVRVDRLDPSKNIVKGFEAYEKLLERQPAIRGKVTFLALLVPSRESIAEYKEYAEQTFALIERINRKYGREGWQPIYCRYGNEYARALAALSIADVVMINSLADGMNLVAKEACLVNEKDSVLMLSKKIGAWPELGRHALGTDPHDTDRTAQVLQEALQMPKPERQRRALALAQQVHKHDLSAWLAVQLQELSQIRHSRVQLRKIAVAR